MLESVCAAELLVLMLQAVEPHQYVLMSDRDGCCFQILVYHVRYAADLKQIFIQSINAFATIHTAAYRQPMQPKPVS